ncbi:GAF domain-containing sensor histidine kinase [Nocardioides sp.]|uniref:GAF domain-containing sensor histidine kinase n=1 Tax=Nocardioides sp. TaxID=35761 RepID=UPI002721DE92|nr:GAF domain-containing sensor histidine kinase [Nocardioides sp.]MDO9454516.1 GAF domain-containing sensor histidine kinase [Nocardioides sp.]
MDRSAHSWAPDATYERYVRLLRHTIDAPIALVSVVEAVEQVVEQAVVAAAGLPGGGDQRDESLLRRAFCDLVVAEGHPVVVGDARQDKRLADSPAISDLQAVACAGWPLTGEHGQVVGSLCVVDTRPHDWTPTELAVIEDLAAACSAELAHARLADELTAANTELQRSNGQLTAFASQVSHDLRTPLVTLSGSLELIEAIGVGDDGGSGQVERLLSKATASTRRMIDLVSTVLDFAMVEGRLTLTDLDLRVLLDAVRYDLADLLGDADISLADPAPVRADAVQISTVLQNLLANAVKYAAGSPIEVAATRDEAGWTLTVADHGPGIAAADRERVLQPLIRLQDDAPSPQRGLGLGLATCHRVALAHGGALTLEETPGGGTTVRLRIPQRPIAVAQGVVVRRKG